MAKHSIWTMPLLTLILASALPMKLDAQAAPAKTVDDIKVAKWNSVPLHGSAYKGIKSGPAPKRDLSGIWDATGDPINGPPAGIQPTGAYEHRAVLPDNNSPPGGEPDERHIPNPLPYTPAGEKALEANKPTGLGVRSVPAVEGNDPVGSCNPPGFPRTDLNEFRNFEILQADDHLAILNQFFRTWRTIWTDGRELPKDPEPRFTGYSVGKWADDYTLVVETIGMRDDTWLDNQGRPHSSELKVEERYHRLDQDHMELSVTITDPKMYTEPWTALNKLPIRRQPKGFDIRELYCAPSDLADYNKDIGEPINKPPEK
jgi:hypothetical protein